MAACPHCGVKLSRGEIVALYNSTPQMSRAEASAIANKAQGHISLDPRGKQYGPWRIDVDAEPRKKLSSGALLWPGTCVHCGRTRWFFARNLEPRRFMNCGCRRKK